MKIKRIIAVLLLFVMAFSLVSCGAPAENNSAQTGAGAADTAGDYYVDLTELGMKITLYLRIREDGTFIFSNTPQFEVSKSEGTVSRSGDEYLMVFTSVNGTEKSISDGISSRFLKMEDGSLDFSISERVYYGTVAAMTKSDTNPDAKFIAHPLTEDFKDGNTETEFTKGIYTAKISSGNSEFTCFVSFFDDDTYLVCATDGTVFEGETGRYGVSSTQLALTPEGGNRVSCEVLGADKLLLSVALPGSSDRLQAEFAKTDASSEPLKSFAGTGRKTGEDKEISAKLSIFEDGSFVVEAEGFEEKGLIVLDSDGASFKIYPDDPNTGERGISRVPSVPAGGLSEEGGKLVISDFRARTSESLGRDKVTFTEN